MNRNLSLALAIGGGVAGLVALHAFLHGQSVAASAITVGATITSPFNVMPDTSGSLVNNAAVTSADAAPIGGSEPATLPIAPATLAGVPLAGWGAALAGMHDAGASA
jgi:hypothetical protein